MTVWRHVVSLCLLAGLALAGAAAAADYPDRAVKIIVPFGAGGPTDVYTRAIAEELRKVLHQPFIMENRPGAGTTIGTDQVAKAPADGYTLLMISGTQTVNETLFAKKPYQLMRDLVPVAPLIDTDLVLVVHPSVPVKTLQEFIALAKSKPGAINYGSSGPGSNYHMAGELLKNMAGIDIVHVPYKGGGPSMQDTISGHVKIIFSSLIQTTPFIQSGQLKALGVGGSKRSPVLPDVPTIAEAGLPDYLAENWWGIVAPAGTPEPIIAKIYAASQEALKSPDLLAAFAREGAAPVKMTRQEFAAYVEKEIAKWGRVVKESGITPQ